MNIQVIGTNWGRKVGFEGITQSRLSNPMSLDEFDINIIDLSCENLWESAGNSYLTVDELNNLHSVQQMVINSAKTQIIYVLPRSIQLSYSFYAGRYNNHVMIKDHIEEIRNKILGEALYPRLPAQSLLFENTRTVVNGIEYEADFYFTNSENVETKSKLSDKITTVSLNDRVMVTSLDITSKREKLINFINFFYTDVEICERPDWFNEIIFYDDRVQKGIIAKQEAEIERAKIAIENANDKLQKNNRYKTILYANGPELVRVVFEILEQLLSCDLSEFEDKKNEDFLIHLDDCTLIGEIKGVTSNVKNDHVGQIEHHYQKYMDDLEENGLTENVHQVLIINPFRTKSPVSREPVNEKQINLAKRNGCLIIETSVLLRTFELCLEGVISSDECIEVFCNKTGLLQLSDFPMK